MKKLLMVIFSIFLTIGMSGQTWKFKHVDSDFDGSYSVIYAKGSGGGFPYESPSFYINNIKGGLNVYIHGLGYTGNDGNRLIFIFDGSRRYELASDLVSASADSESLFISGARREGEAEELTIYHLLNEIGTSSRMSVRFKNDYKTNTFSYRLDGSSSALSKFFGQNFLENKLLKLKTEKSRLKKERQLALSRNRFVSDSINSRADSLHSLTVIRNAIRESRVDSITESFIGKSKINGWYLKQQIGKTKLIELRREISKNYKLLKPSDILIEFKIVTTDSGYYRAESGYYRIMIIYKDENNNIKERYVNDAWHKPLFLKTHNS